MHDEELTDLSRRISLSAGSNKQQQTGEQPGTIQPKLHHKPTHAPTSITLTNAPNASAKATMRIGWWLLLVIITSFLVLSVAIAFLSWLWFASRESEAWRRIMLDGRSTQSITLAGVLIRVAIGSLATLSTSMIASIAFESHGVPVYAMAQVSITRFTNNGPLSLFSLILFTSTFGTHLRILTTTLLLFVFGSQFTSTMLVSDLAESRIASFEQQTNYGYDYKQEKDYFYGQFQAAQGVYYWDRRPPISEIFAEYSQPVDPVDGVDDTGPTIRAFLPVPVQSDRESLRSFKGMARVFDARVVCVRPKAVLHYCWMETDVGEPASYLCGNVAPDLQDDLHTAPYIHKLQSTDLQFELKCPIPGEMFPGFLRQSWLLCLLRPSVFDAVDKDQAWPQNTIGTGNSWFLSDLRPPTLHFMPDSYRKSMTTKNATWAPLNSTKSGPWLRQWSQVTLPDWSVTTDVHLQMTLCFDALNVTSPNDVYNLNITADSLSNHTEPAFAFKHEQGIYDTLAVRRQLGAVTHEEKEAGPDRQILTISPEGKEASLNNSGKMHLEPSYKGIRFNWLTNLMYLYKRGVSFCFTCISTPDLQLADDVKTQVFIDIINKTTSPALALQALNTIGLRQAYHDQIAAFPRAKYATMITRWELAQTPQHFRAFTAVMIIIAVNMSIFVFVCIWFSKATESSLIGNVWQTIAQVAKSPETKQVLDHAMLAKDKDVENLIRGRSPTEAFDQSIKNSLHWVSRIFKKEKPGNVERLPLRNQMVEEA